MELPQIFSGKRKGLFIRLLANAVMQAFILYVNAMLIRYAFDHFIDGRDVTTEHLFWPALAMCTGGLATGWFQMRERVAAEQLGQSYIHSLRMRLFRQVSRMDPRLLQKRRRGAVMLKFVSDLNSLRRWISLGIVRIVMSGTTILSTLIILSLIDWTLSAVTAMLIGLGIFVNIRIGESLQSVVGETRKRRSRLSGNINEKLARMSVVQAFGRREDEIRKVRRQSVLLRRALVDRAAKIGAIRGVTHACAALAVAVVLLIGIFKVSSGATTPGTVAAAMVVVGFLVPALKNLGRVYGYYQDALVSRDKLNQFLKIKPHIKIGTRLPDLTPSRGQLNLENVVVNGVFDNVTIEVSPGKVVAVIGPNGAGKSVLIDLVARLVPPDNGRILIDGQDTSRFSVDSVRRMVGIVSPDLPLLSGSLKKNLSYRSPDSSSTAVERIRKLCGIDELVSQLPRGENTKIREGGRNLSMGQRQRILLARALLGGPRILLLDEIDAHLDDRAKQAVRDVIRTFRGTVLWVTHQQIPLVGVDTIWRIEDNHINAIEIEHLYQRKRASG